MVGDTMEWKWKQIRRPLKRWRDICLLLCLLGAINSVRFASQLNVRDTIAKAHSSCIDCAIDKVNEQRRNLWNMVRLWRRADEALQWMVFSCERFPEIRLRSIWLKDFFVFLHKCFIHLKKADTFGSVVPLLPWRWRGEMGKTIFNMGRYLMK